MRQRIGLRKTVQQSASGRLASLDQVSAAFAKLLINA
jgi:hypothetical protein